LLVLLVELSPINAYFGEPTSLDIPCFEYAVDVGDFPFPDLSGQGTVEIAPYQAKYVLP
jgi:hypothetical protein